MHPCIHASMHPCIHACIHASMHACIYTSIYLPVLSLRLCVMYIYVYELYLHGHLTYLCKIIDINCRQEVPDAHASHQGHDHGAHEAGIISHPTHIWKQNSKTRHNGYAFKYDTQYGILRTNKPGKKRYTEAISTLKLFFCNRILIMVSNLFLNRVCFASQTSAQGHSHGHSHGHGDDCEAPLLLVGDLVQGP